MSKTDRHLLHQKVRQRISVMKIQDKTKCGLKCQFSGNIVCLLSLLRFFDELFDGSDATNELEILN